jgi:pimeloyl-ACP methyl ester carboxylesterase
MPLSDTISYLDLSKPSRRLAYFFNPAVTGKPTIVFLSGFRSDMSGEKVKFVQNFCETAGIGFLAFDYTGHGLSSGKFEDCTLTQWLDDSLNIIHSLSLKSVIIVGSSMGGWLGFLVALRIPGNIRGLVAIAPAPDFTQKLIENKFSDHQKRDIDTQGYTTVHTDYSPDGFIITKSFIESGRKLCLLNSRVKLTIPIRLLHGMDDQTIPYAYSQKLAKLISGDDVILTLIKSGDHRLSRPQDLKILQHNLEEILILGMSS